MAGVSRAFVVGGPESWSRSIAKTLECDVSRSLPEDLGPGDVVVLDAATPHAAGATEFGNAFSTCRQLKRDPQVLVFVAARADDPFAVEIARFCMADGVLPVGADDTLSEVERVRERASPRRGRLPIDSLLERLEGNIAGDEDLASSGLQRILTQVEDSKGIGRWTDPETGLFDGPFAGFKLDEEFKRAMRFHHPLSLVLLDVGVAAWPTEPEARTTVLAEVASIFLNECRDIDVLARFTDTVFLFLLPGTGPDGASIAARRMVDAIVAREFAIPIALAPVAGIATIPDPAVRDRRSFLARAEAALDRARSGTEGSVCRANP